MESTEARSPLMISSMKCLHYNKFKHLWRTEGDAQPKSGWRSGAVCVFGNGQRARPRGVKKSGVKKNSKISRSSKQDVDPVLNLDWLSISLVRLGKIK